VAFLNDHKFGILADSDRHRNIYTTYCELTMSPLAINFWSYSMPVDLMTEYMY